MISITDLKEYENWCRSWGWHGYTLLRGRCRILGVPNRLLAAANTGPMPRFYNETESEQ